MTQSIDPNLMKLIEAEADAETTKVAANTAAAEADLADYAQELLALKDSIDQLDAQRKDAQARYDELRKSIIPDLMRKRGMVTSDGRGSFTFSGGRLALQNELHAYVRADDRKALAEYLKANGAGDLVKEEVNAQTLKAHCRALQEEGQPLPPMVSVHHENKVTLTRSKAR